MNANDIFSIPEAAKKKREHPTEFDNAVNALVRIFGFGIKALPRFTFQYPILSMGIFIITLWASDYIVRHHLHLKLLIEPLPEFAVTHVVQFFNPYSIETHLNVIFSIFFFILVCILGNFEEDLHKKYEMIFEDAKIKSGRGNTPKLVRHRKLDKYKEEFEFKAPGIDIKSFIDQKGHLESSLKKSVLSIKNGKDLSRVLITFSTFKIPDYYSYKKLSEENTLPPDSFFVGISKNGIVTQKVSELPHMLISGATGSGKSVFFKQALLGLLESSPNIKMHLIDLKGGLEMIDFKGSPNVKIVKNFNEAVILLRVLKKEMQNRFKFLEARGLKKIDPIKHKKPRIVLAIDEAAVLYANRPKTDPDYLDIMEARNLTADISRLSRAAGIHLLLATQKIDQQVIPTHVSENITGRMAFKANSLQGSLVALGTKAAFDLPNVSGRGAWSNGSEAVVIQAPFISGHEISKRVSGTGSNSSYSTKRTDSEDLPQEKDLKQETIISEADKITSTME